MPAPVRVDARVPQSAWQQIAAQPQVAAGREAAPRPERGLTDGLPAPLANPRPEARTETPAPAFAPQPAAVHPQDATAPVAEASSPAGVGHYIWVGDGASEVYDMNELIQFAARENAVASVDLPRRLSPKKPIASPSITTLLA